MLISFWARILNGNRKISEKIYRNCGNEKVFEEIISGKVFMNGIQRTVPLNQERFPHFSAIYFRRKGKTNNDVNAKG